MRALAALALTLWVVACGTVPPRLVRATPRASTSAVAAASPASAPRTTGVSGLPLDRVGFSCDLPVVSTVDNSTPQFSGGDGFLSLPGRELRQDPSQAHPYYDRAVNQWLPVEPSAVSPDGRRYAAIEPGMDATATHARVPTRLWVYDAATNAALRVVTMPGAIEYQIAHFASTGIELVVAGPGIGAPLPGVWSVNPDSGIVTKVSTGYDLPSAQWIRDSTGSRIIHRDPAGGTTSWFSVPGEGLGFVPFAGDSALLVAGMRQNLLADLWLVRRPGDAVQIVTGAVPESPYWMLALGVSPSDIGTVDYLDKIVDQHGIWLSYSDLFLATPSGAILHVDNRAVYPAGTCA